MIHFSPRLSTKIVACQLAAYIGLLLVLQSGFHKENSTETLLVRLQSDKYNAMDRFQITLLALIDVSAAFDTVDHDILLHRLSVYFGLTGKQLDWDVLLGWCVTTSCFALGLVVVGLAGFGLSQDSSMGSMLYVHHAACINARLASSAVLSQSYADDTQACLLLPGLDACRQPVAAQSL